MICAAVSLSADGQGDGTFREIISALSGRWSIHETSDHLDRTGEEVWQGGTDGTPLTDEFHSTKPNKEKWTEYAAVWWDSKAKEVRGIWCADFNDQGCTPFKMTRGRDIEMTGEYENVGISIAWKKVFHVTSATTLTQTFYMGRPGGGLKQVSIIVAKRKP